MEFRACVSSIFLSSVFLAILNLIAEFWSAVRPQRTSPIEHVVIDVLALACRELRVAGLLDVALRLLVVQGVF
eukprot:12567946-Heterocapsa_arctica.AAC.1